MRGSQEGVRKDPSLQITSPSGLFRTPVSSTTGFGGPSILCCKDILCEPMKFEEAN